MPDVDIPGVGTVAFPDSMSRQDISAAAKRLHDQKAAPQGLPDLQQQGPSGLVKGALGLLPAAGGALGGLAGAGAGSVFGLGVGAVPGAVGGATLGGAGGEALKQMIEQGMGSGPQSSLEAAKGIGIQGGVQGLSELAGVGLARGAAKLAQPFSKKFGAQLASKTQDVLYNAGKAKVRIQPADVVTNNPQLGEVLKDASALGKGAVDSVHRILNDITDRAGKYTPDALHRLKVMADQRTYGALKQGETLAARTWEAVGNQARALLKSKVPGYSEIMAKESRNIAAQKVGSKVAKVVGGGIVGGAAAHMTPGVRDLPWYAKYPIGAAAGAAALSPPVLGAGAEALMSPLLQAALKQVPRAGAAAYQELNQ